MTREEAIKRLEWLEMVAEYVDSVTIGSKCTEDWEAYNMAIAALREQPQWISVEERLPEPDTDVLARRSTGTMDVEVYHEDEVAWTWDGYSKGFVTHWMPLPEAPEVEV